MTGLIAFCAATGPAQAAVDPASPLGRRDMIARMGFGAPVVAPYAHVRFCMAHPGQCARSKVSIRKPVMRLTAERQAWLDNLNRRVNRSIRARPDLRGPVNDQWSLAPPAGDCDDFAVTKRQALLAAGWPSNAALLVRAQLPNGQYHLVVMVRTDRGDLLLDNLTDAISPWTRPLYRWVDLQSTQDPRIWRRVAHGRAAGV
jgi:predicted transglutaminase-like cysteine proteinase